MKQIVIRPTTLTTLMERAFMLLCCSMLMLAGVAFAETIQQIKNDPGNNNGPPPGAIYDLNGTPIPGGGDGVTYQQYTVNFQAALSSTAITFAFRDDPAFISFANASVVDLTTNSANLLTNGDFSQGTDPANPPAPVGWTYSNQYGAAAGGLVQTGCGTYAFCWFDGAVQAYDAISQTIPTNVGDNYQITFFVAEDSGCSTDGGPPCNFSDLSTNGDTTDTGGNGIDVTVYAQAGLPPPNQPLTVTLLGNGSGTVTDNTEQINCVETSGVQSGTCSANYPVNTVVTLSATPADDGSTFDGWGGACLSFGTTSPCTVTMNSAQNVTASFDAPGAQSQTQNVPSGATTPFNYNGGYQEGNPNTGYDYTINNSGQSLQVTVTALTMTQDACSTLVQPSFPGAKCFEYINAITVGSDASVMFEVTCPPNGCGSNENPFSAILASDFSFNCTENSPLQCGPPPAPYSFGLPNLTSVDSLPEVGFLKGAGPDPNHPCTPFPGNTPPLFQSNQVIGATFVTDNGTRPTQAGSGGTGSCWTITYLTPGELPTVSITQPVNGANYQQNEMDGTTVAIINCTAVNAGPASPTGPYLTVSQCFATDNPGGNVNNGQQFDTSTLGPHTFTAYVQDSATNTNSATVTYNVLGSQTITFPPIPNQTYGVAPFALNATASSGLPVSYAVLSGPATVSGNMLTITGTGLVTVQATQPGNANYSPAPPVSQSFTVTPANSSTTVQSNLNPSNPGQAVTFTATVTGAGATPTGTVAWSGNTGCGTTALSGGIATCTTSSLPTGTDVVTGTYSGDSNHNGSAGSVNQIVNQPPAITSANSVTFTLGVASAFTVTTTGSPTPSIVEAGTLPNGVSFVDNHNGTGTLGGTPTQAGTFNITFTASNGVGSPAVQNFTLTTSGPLLSVTPSSYNFGTVDLFFFWNPGIVTVKNIGSSNVNISRVWLTLGGGTDSDDFTLINLCPSTLAPGKTCYISVLFVAEDVGSLSATLNIADNAPGSPQQVSYSAIVINPLISFNPSRLNFGTVKVGHSSTQNVTVSNPGTTPLTINSITVTGTNAHDFVPTNGCPMYPNTLAANGNCVVQVTFTPGATGPRSAKLIVVDNAPLSPQAVPLAGKGD